MKSIIKELWRGNVMPPEDSRHNTPEMKQLLEYISRHNDDQLKTMTDEQKDGFGMFEAAGVSTQTSPIKSYSDMHSNWGQGWELKSRGYPMNAKIRQTKKFRKRIIKSY